MRPVPIAIVTFWVVMTGWLVYREVVLPRIHAGRFSENAYPDRPSDNWLGVYLPGEKPIGYIHVNTRPERRGEEPGTRMTMTANMTMHLFGEATTFTIAGRGWASRNTGLSEFDVALRSGGHELRIEGEVDEGMLHALLHTGDEAIPFEWPVQNELVLWTGTGATNLNMPALRPGQEFYVESFDPVTLSMGRAHIECIGLETIEIAGTQVETSVTTMTIGSVTSKAWVQQNGEVVRAETPFGFTLQKTAPSAALAAVPEDSGESLIELTAIRPTGKAPFRGAGVMTFGLTGVAEGISPPEDETQSRGEDGLYTIRRPEEPKGDAEQAAPPGPSFLAATPFVQTNHADIQSLAKELTAGVPDPWRKAVRVHAWVYENIAKVPVISVPSALDVLRTREGDCNEHTVLYTALARAAGVSTRIAIGIVWSEQLNGFYYHAWPEVFVDGRWIWMDPTLDQVVADATHVKLLNGDIEKWTQLLPYLGQMELEVVEIQ